MKKKWILIVFLSLILLGVLAGGIYYFVSHPAKSDLEDVDEPSKEEIQAYVDNFDVSNIAFLPIPDSVYKYSAKFKLFDDVFSSEKPVFAYGYEKGSRIKKLSESFHKTVQKDLEKRGLDEKYNVVVISKPEVIVNDVMKKNKLEIPKDESPCDLKDGDTNGVLDIAEFISECYSEVCLIDAKNKKYIVLPKKYPEIFLKLLEVYK